MGANVKNIFTVSSKTINQEIEENHNNWMQHVSRMEPI